MLPGKPTPVASQSARWKKLIPHWPCSRALLKIDSRGTESKYDQPNAPISWVLRGLLVAPSSSMGYQAHTVHELSLAAFDHGMQFRRRLRWRLRYSRVAIVAPRQPAFEIPKTFGSEVGFCAQARGSGQQILPGLATIPENHRSKDKQASSANRRSGQAAKG